MKKNAVLFTDVGKKLITVLFIILEFSAEFRGGGAALNIANTTG